MASDPRKRLRYFNGQFLQADDFIAEQGYHIDRQRRHNRFLHTPGVADGLRVEVPLGTTTANVTAGTAIDREGRQIILTGDEPIRNLSSFADKKVLVVISYPDPEPEDDPATVGERQNTRLLEEGVIQLLKTDATGQPIPVEGETFPPDRYIRLALLTLGSGGSVNAKDLSVQSKAGTKIGDAVFSKVTLSNDFNQFPALSSGAANRVDLQGNLVVSGNIIGPMKVDGRLDTRANNPQKNPGVDTVGAAFVYNSAAGFGLVAKVTTTPGAIPGTPTNTTAAVAGISDIPAVNGVYATARSGTHALKVEGTAQISIPDTTQTALFVDGSIKATGPKGGYVVDTFINASGQKVLVGDVVRLKGTPIARFEGQNSRIPVAEVTLADKENDSMVIGIVAQEAIPDPDSLDTRVEPNDPTFIEDGGELYLVTLGAFAHCKVDATDAPIEVGDLLTTSNNPGHAKKATNPTIGSIIGKAFEPLKEGTGYVAVFVNIQ